MNINDPGLFRPYICDDGIARVTYVDGMGDFQVKEYDGSQGPAIYTKIEWMQRDQEVVKEFRKAAPLAVALRDIGLTFDLTSSSHTRGATHLVDSNYEFEERPFIPGQKVGYALPLNPLTCPVFDPDFIQDFGSAAAKIGKVVDQSILGNMTIGAKKPVEFFGLLNSPNVILVDSEGEAIKRLHERFYIGPYLHIAGRQRAIAEEFLSRNDIKTVITPNLKDDRCIMVQMTSDVIRLVIAMDVMPIQVDGKFLILACLVPQIRQNMNGDTGIAIVG